MARNGHPLPVATDSVRAGAESVLGDRKHRVAIVVLAAVLALDGADRTALGALAPALKSEFGVGNTAIGLLASAFAIVGALAIVPIGILTDRARRITILVVCIGIWCLAMGVAAAAMSFAVLFAARVSLGVHQRGRRSARHVARRRPLPGRRARARARLGEERRAGRRRARGSWWPASWSC